MTTHAAEERRMREQGNAMTVPQDVEQGLNDLVSAAYRLGTAADASGNLLAHEQVRIRGTIRTALADHQALVERCERLRSIVVRLDEVYDDLGYVPSLLDGPYHRRKQLHDGDLANDLVPAQDEGD